MSNIKTVSSVDEFQSIVTDATGKQLVKFTAPWCGPCKMMKPVDEGIAAEIEDVDVVYVDVDQASEVAQKYGVRGVPTYFVFKDGTKGDKAVVGAKSKADMVVFVNEA